MVRAALHVSRNKRRKNRDPETPDVHKACSKRSFDGLVKKWRRLLHQYDPQEEEQGQVRHTAGD